MFIEVIFKVCHIKTKFSKSFHDHESMQNGYLSLSDFIQIWNININMNFHKIFSIFYVNTTLQLLTGCKTQQTLQNINVIWNHFYAYHNTLRLETNIFFSLPSNNLRIIMGVYCLFIICKYEFVSFLALQDTENGRVEVWSKLPITVKLMENNCIGCLVK